MYSAVSHTISSLSRDRLDAIPGFTLLLHTWSQTIAYHPHIHCVLAGGGLSPDGNYFRSFKKKFFLHVKILSKVFHDKFLDALKGLYNNGLIKFFGNVAFLQDNSNFQDLIDVLYSKDWVVFSKPVFKCAEHVLKYLGKYTHRVAISNHRILNVNDQAVSFKYNDNKDHGKKKVMTLSNHEFIRPFLLHILPHRFVKVRHYGFLSNRFRSMKVALCRKLLLKQRGVRLQLEHLPFNPIATLETLISKDKITCPVCGCYLTYVHNRLVTNTA